MKKTDLLLLLLTVILMFAKCTYDVFFSLNALPEGELISSSVSPDETYEVKIYLCNGGATVDYAIRGELVYKNKAKNIYWAYHEQSAEVEWLDNYTVMINDIILDVRYEEYDYRKHSNGTIDTVGVSSLCQNKAIFLRNASDAKARLE